VEPILMHNDSLNNSQLGKKTEYIATYTPSLLFPIARDEKRNEINVPANLPFTGFDIWNAFEISWLNAAGKPCIAIAEFFIPCESECLIESKSFKLYLNSFNQERFESAKEVETTLISDLSKSTGANVKVNIILPSEFHKLTFKEPEGVCLDDLEFECDVYEINSSFLKTNNIKTNETLFSNLLKSNCLVTGQPDWASIQIRYTGNQIDHEGLLRYLISFRNHNEFHEQCVERIFMDITNACQPEKLTVYARYTRRGGLDINPFRSNFEELPKNVRFGRQ